MSGKFEWHTMEEAGWEEADAAGEEGAASGGRPLSERLSSRRYLLLAMLLLSVLFASRQILLRAQETNEQIEADVRAAYGLLAGAALDRDMERLELVLSKKELQWRQMQRVLLRRDLLFDRGPLNLWLEDTLPAAQAVWEEKTTPVLSPDLATAELTTSLRYLTQRAGGALEPLTLQRTWHFAYDRGQWRLVPPGEAYWGATEQYSGQMVRVEFPARDGEIGRFLAAAIEKAFVDLCKTETAVPCTTKPAIQITFSADLETFLALSQPVQGNRFWIFAARMADGDGFDISVPTPSLVGLPVSAADREALAKGYSGWLLTAYLTRKYPDLSFEHIEQVLSDLELQLPPPAGYRPAGISNGASPPGGQALVSCYDGGQPAERRVYDLARGEWTRAEPAEEDGRGEEATAVDILPSADGRFLLSGLAPSQPIQLSTGDGRALAALAEAAYPVWIDGTSFAFISVTRERATYREFSDAAPGDAVQIARLGGEQEKSYVTTREIVTQETLLAALPGNRFIQSLHIDAILRPPDAPGLLLLAGSGSHEQFLFEVPLEGGGAQFVTGWVDNGSNLRTVELTKNGRFLTVVRSSTRHTYLTLIDLESGQRRIMELEGRPFSRYAWSADEAWLLVADDRLLHLINPGSGEELTVKHTGETCTAVSWLE